MNLIPDNYFSDLVSYEDFVLRSNLLGYDVSNPIILESLRKVEDYYLIVVNERLCFLDSHGNKAENVVIKGDLTVSDYDIVSLEGSPKEVGGTFDCSYCDSLVSLEGCPNEVGGYFSCSRCKSLVSLKGSPEEVGGYFNCSHCDSLVSLEGSPRKVGGFFDCSHCDSLVSLKGAPKEVGGGYFGSSWCKSLISFERRYIKVKGHLLSEPHTVKAI